MKHIQGFLKKGVSFPVLEKQISISEIIFKETNQRVDCHRISFSGKTIFLKVDVVTKIKILLKKNAIIHTLGKEKTLSFFSDIK